MQNPEPEDSKFLDRAKIVGEFLNVDDPDNIDSVVTELITKMVYINPKTDEPYPESEIDSNFVELATLLEDIHSKVMNLNIPMSVRSDMLEAWMTVAVKLKEMMDDRAAGVAVGGPSAS